MALDYLPTDPWLAFGLGWESRRLTPIFEDDVDPDAPPRSREQFMDIVLESPTPAMQACQQAGEAQMERLRADDDLRKRFAERGVEHLRVSPAFVDLEWEPGFASPRYKFKRRKRYLDVDVWYIYDGPIEPEAFGDWVYETVRADLEAWLHTH